MKLGERFYTENVRPDGEAGAVKRARRVLMMSRAWPLCQTCTTPFELIPVMNYVGNAAEIDVMTWCTKCTETRLVTDPETNEQNMEIRLD